MEVKSLAVPLVQEIAKEGLKSVPERYVRPLDQRPILLSSSSVTDPLPQIPVLDLSKLLSQDLKEPELHKLHYACKDWGFFQHSAPEAPVFAPEFSSDLVQLINHGVSTSLLESVKRGASELFNLPVEEKKKFGQREGDAEGYGQLFVVSEDQKLEWGDMLFMLTLPPHQRKPHLLPHFPLPFRDDLEMYSVETNKLAIQILSLMANALSMDTKEMSEKFTSGTQCMRLNYYPPCPQPELVMGINPHSDDGGLTVLLQANDVQGLQIKKDGHWIPVKPLPNAFIINIGDALEIITNGIYKGVEHRATVNSEKERISIVTFNSPSMESIVGPAASLVTPGTPPLFKSLSYEEYLRGFLSRELLPKSFLNTLRIPTANHQQNSLE